MFFGKLFLVETLLDTNLSLHSGSCRNIIFQIFASHSDYDHVFKLHHSFDTLQVDGSFSVGPHKLNIVHRLARFLFLHSLERSIETRNQ
jgi:hypothetical protein